MSAHTLTVGNISLKQQSGQNESVVMVIVIIAGILCLHTCHTHFQLANVPNDLRYIKICPFHLAFRFFPIAHCSWVFFPTALSAHTLKAGNCASKLDYGQNKKLFFCCYYYHRWHPFLTHLSYTFSTP